MGGVGSGIPTRKKRLPIPNTATTRGHLGERSCKVILYTLLGVGSGIPIPYIKVVYKGHEGGRDNS